MVEEQKTAFNMCDCFAFVCKAEEITYSVTKVQVTKSSKILEPVQSKQFPGGRKNSEG